MLHYIQQHSEHTVCLTQDTSRLLPWVDVPPDQRQLGVEAEPSEGSAQAVYRLQVTQVIYKSHTDGTALHKGAA